MKICTWNFMSCALRAAGGMVCSLSLAVFVGMSVCHVSDAFADVKPLSGAWLEPGETLLCFGDSLTAHGGYVKELQARLAAKNIKVVNGGLSGDKTPTALVRLQKVVDDAKPDAILVFFGANDAVIGKGQWRDEPKVSPECYRDNLEWIVHYCRMHTRIRKYSIAPPTGGIEGSAGYPFGEVRREYCLAAREAADFSNAVFVPLDCVFEHVRSGMSEDARGHKLTVDGIHLNDEGNKLAAEAMLCAWNMKDVR